jgi:beta-lactamase class A
MLAEKENAFVRRLIFAATILFSISPAFSPQAEARPRFDVSYLRSPDLEQVLSRKKAVAGALGVRVSKKLAAVRVPGGYAVIYLRRGDARAAAATAAAHTRILKAQGLGAAVPVRSVRWRIVQERAAPPAKKPPRRKPARKKPAPAPAPAAQASVPAVEASTLPAPVAAAAGSAAEKAAERLRLERLVDEHIKQLRKRGRIASDELTAWFVYDFTTGEKLVEINTDIKLQAASLIKPFIALAFMHQVREGKMAYDDPSRAQMERMIQHSNNASTNWVMRRLGGPAAVAALLKKNYGSVLHDVELVEYIPPGGRTYKNKASVQDYGAFLFALWNDQIPGSDEIKRLMALPKKDRLHTRAAVPDGTEVYSKTGTTRRLLGDIGVLSAKGPDGKQYAYTVVGIIEKKRPARNYHRWMRARGDVIREISGLVYRAIGSIHGFGAKP